MALIDDDQIEEVLRILAIESRPVFIPRDRLVDGEIHVAALDRDAAGDFLAGIAERAEVLRHRIVDEDIAKLIGYGLFAEPKPDASPRGCNKLSNKKSSGRRTKRIAK